MEDKKVSKRQQGRIIKNARNWWEMEGDTELEKKINSFLTVQYIFEKDVPADECLQEAKELLELVHAHYHKDDFQL